MPLGAFRINSLSKFVSIGGGAPTRDAKTITAISDAQISTSESKFGSASAMFDATSDALHVQSNDFAFGTSDFTLECWVRSSYGNNQGVFQLANSFVPAPYDEGIGAIIGPTTSTRWMATFGGSFYNGPISSAPEVVINQWYHIAFVRTNGTTTFYVDGTNEFSAADTFSYNTTYLTIGGWYSGGYYLEGFIDEFRISNVARYTANFTPATQPHVNDANTLLLLHCDGTNGSTVFTDDNGAT